MWIVQCKLNKDSQSCSILGSYDKKTDAIIHASRVSSECFLVLVTCPEGKVIWSNYQ